MKINKFDTTRLVFALMSGAAVGGLAAGSAQAGGFASRLGSTDATAQAWAGSAAAGLGIGGISINPAVVTSLDGVNSEAGGAVVLPDARIGPTTFNATSPAPGLTGFAISQAVTNAAIAGGSQTDNFGTSVITAGSYFNVQLSKEWYFGISVTAPYGLGVNFNGNSGFSADRTRARVTTTNVQPVLGYKINDQLSVGIGVQFQYINLTFEQTGIARGLGGFSPALGAFSNVVGQVTGSDVGIGFSAGLTYTPFKGTEFGIGYRSSVSHSAVGRQSFSGAVPGLPGTPGSFIVNINQTLPELVTASIRQTLNDQLAVSLTGEWTNWRRVRNIIVGGSPTGSTLPLNFRDGWFVSIGGEYKFDPKWTLRAGVAYDFSPVTDIDRTLSVPDSDRLIFSGGLQYRYSNQLTLSAAYTAELFDRAPINRTINGPAALPFALNYSTRTDITAHIISFGATIKLDHPPEKIEPLVTK